VMSHNPALREGLYLQIAMAGGIPADPRSQADAILIDAGTGTTPDLIVHPDPSVPAVVLLTPNGRGGLDEMRAIGFVSYLVKPVRQASLISRLVLCRREKSAALASDPPTFAPPESFIAPSEDLPPLVAPQAPCAAPAFDPPAIPAPFLENRPAAARASYRVAPVVADPPKPLPVPAPSAQSQAPCGEGLHVLLAEDNPINMMLIRELLRRRGHRVTEVTTGNDAVKAVGAGRFDLLLTDIHMPGMDGIDAAQAIRANEIRDQRPRTPIVALTADALDEGRRTCLEAGMDGFLTKPVDPAELEEMFLMLFPHEDGSHIVAA
jgi:CheY-like chemotaxis protein